MCAVFMCVQTMVWLAVLAILSMCEHVGARHDTQGAVQMLAHVTIHRGMYKHHKGLHAMLTIGEKSLAALGRQTCVKIAPVFLV